MPPSINTVEIPAPTARFATQRGAAWAERFDDVTARLLHAWRVGAFGPRLEGASGSEPRQCEWCAVSAACLRGDSGARRRLMRWLESVGDEAPDHDAEAALASALALHGGTR